MVDYSKGKIYRIVCNVTGKQYVGSTTQSLAKRLACHRADYKRYQKGEYHSLTSFEVLEGGNFSIVLLEEVHAESKEQLQRRERYWIEKLECVNQVVPTRTYLEYYQDNKEKEKNRKFQYYHNVKDRINQKHDCPCGGRYATQSKAQHERTKKHQDYLATQVSDTASETQESDPYLQPSPSIP